ncbi:MAG: molecular chaperone [Methylophilaceae bacterium]
MKNSIFSMRSFLILCSAFVLLSTFTTSATAGLFSVSPVRIYMAPKDRAIAVTITNDSDEELVMQADIYTWKQGPNGEEELTLSEDLFLSPPIIKLAGKARQVVRLAVLSPSKSNDELTYRMIIREIPVRKPATEDAELEIALAFSMPVFITPKTAKNNLICTAERSATDQVKATCENTGNAYAHPREFAIKNNAGETIATRESGGYILQGIKRSFDVKAKNGSIAGGKANLTVTLDDTSKKDFEINLAH